MATLSLFRHAKSSWTSGAAGDFDRPLSPRGEKAASRMGRYMAREGLEPEIVWCSTAVRARRTLELAAAEWKGKPDIRYEDGLYHAAPGEMLQLVKALPAQSAHAMLVGHNPGMHALAVALLGDGEPDAMAALRAKFPTAALAVIGFGNGWETAAQGAGYLRRFVRPRELPADL